jgi:AcrR family transcriptional regulator
MTALEPRPEPRAPLTRERVLRAALQIADDAGIEALSMRKLGQALGVEAMSLYNHVANKDDLLDGIVDLAVREIELPSTAGDWEPELRACAISAHEAFLRHPWACRLVLSSRVLSSRLRYLEAILGKLRTSGFSAETTYHAYHALDSHILGFTLWEAGHKLPSDVPQEFVSSFLRTLPANEYPHLVEHIHQHVEKLGRDADDEEGEFEFGLDLILDSLRRMRDSE